VNRVHGGRWPALALVALTASVLLAGCNSMVRGDPDPGGTTMDALKSVETGLPPDATNLQRQYAQSHWDSCDGRAGTEGWSDIQVILTFNIVGEPEALLDYAGSHLSEAGWTSESSTPTPLGPSESWTRTLPGGTQARAILGQNARSATDKYWSLMAIAPPKGQRATGC
jgi:hypothetical protein